MTFSRNMLKSTGERITSLSNTHCCLENFFDVICSRERRCLTFHTVFRYYFDAAIDAGVILHYLPQSILLNTDKCCFEVEVAMGVRFVLQFFLQFDVKYLLQSTSVCIGKCSKLIKKKYCENL